MILSKTSKKPNRRKTVSKLIAIVLILAAIYLFVGVGRQIFETLQLRKQEEEVAAQLAALQEENAALKAQKNKLEDPNYIITYAHGEYLFSKDDEKVFYLPSLNTPEATPQPSETPVSTPEATPEPTAETTPEPEN